MSSKRTPLTNRLRHEAELWSRDEPARALMLEAAVALERIAAEVERLLAERKEQH